MRGTLSALFLLATTLPAQITTPTYPVGINCGAAVDYLDQSVAPATKYLADRVFGDGNLGLGYRTDLPTRIQGLVPVPVGGTSHDSLYHASRDSVLSGNPAKPTPVAYSFAVPSAGDYLVTLHVRDAWGNDSFWNPMQVELEGVVQPGTIEPSYPNQRFYASRYAYRVTVTDGTLDVRLLPRLLLWPVFHEYAQLSAIRVDHLPAPKPLTPPSTVSASAGYRSAIIRWSFAADHAIAGYEVERTIGTENRIVDGRIQHGDRIVDDLCFASLQANALVAYRVRTVDVFGNRSAWSAARTIQYLPQEASSLPYYEVAVSSLTHLWVQDYFASYLINDASTEFPGVFRTVPPANIIFDTIYRYRGFSTLLAPKKGRKLKFNSGHPFGPNPKWRSNLNGDFYDSTLLHSAASFELWSLAQQPGARVEPVNLSVAERLVPYRSPHLGLHMSIENYDEEWIRRTSTEWGGRHPLSTTGKLYKGDGVASMVKLSSLADYQANYTLEVGSSGNKHKDLIQLIETIDDATKSGTEKMRWLAENVDLENLFVWYALHQLIADGDYTWHNFFLYRYPGNAPQGKRGKWMIIPWDKDITWMNGDIFVQLPLEFGSFGNPFTMGVARNRLITILVSHETSPTLAFRQYYHETLTRLQQDPLWTGALGRIAAFAQRILPEARKDPWKQGWDDNSLVEAGFADVSAFQAKRDAFITANLPGLATPDQTDVRLEELQVVNTSTIRDPDVTSMAEYDAWIELRNYGPVPRDLSGWSLTNDDSVPTKWSFPSGTTIPALGRLLVWLDGQPAQGALHASFTPDDSLGGALSLYRFEPGPVLVDRISHTASQTADTSIGRHPTTGALLANALVWPTPGYLNWPGSQLPQLRIEEVLADNTTGILDDYGARNGWVEIHNAEAVPVSLGGHFLTNDIGRTIRWQFPDLEIAPGASVLVWADSRPERARWLDGTLGNKGTLTFHTDFNISKNGATLELTSKTFGDAVRVLQTLSVPSLASNRSYGRNSSGQYVVFTTPTPGTPNP